MMVPRTVLNVQKKGESLRGGGGCLPAPPISLTSVSHTHTTNPPYLHPVEVVVEEKMEGGQAVVQPYAFRLFRLVFFGILAVDTTLHGAVALLLPASGASAFRASKLPFVFEGLLDFVPTALLVSRLLLVTAVASCVASLGSDRYYHTASLVASAAYSIAYFSSVLDRYQHHLLLSYLLVLLPWAPTRAWVQRLIAWQVSIVYFWTVVTKLSDGGVFLNGDFVRSTAQLRGVFDAVHTVSSTIGVADTTMWTVIAVGVVAVEVLLCVLLLPDHLRVLSIVPGVALHAGIEVLGTLSIGFFSFYMLAFYLLWLPPVPLQVQRWTSWVASLARRAEGPSRGPVHSSENSKQ